MKLWFFRRISASEAARELGAIRIANERKRIRAVTRQMRRELGLPPCPHIEERN